MNKYVEFAERGGLSGRKGVVKKSKPNKSRLNLCLLESTKERGQELASSVNLSLSTFVEQLLNSQEAEQFTNRIKP